MDVERNWRRWLERADESLQGELRAMEGDPARMADAFCRDLVFGTGGLRGVMGAGTNRVNLHTVARASQGVANYVRKHFRPARRRVAIGYDSRLLSETFARTAAGVLAAADIQVLIYPRLMPTPCLSWAVRALDCAAGVMITASHNPAEYNGYKVYGPDGCHITSGVAAEILAEIEALDMFDGPRSIAFEEGLTSGRVGWIRERVVADYLAAVKAQSLLGDDPADRAAAIAYTPLNGTGLGPVTRVLSECGFTGVTVVPEQAEPDGRFPTCPKPNPELPEALALGLEHARRTGADLLLATDPDCDRCAIAVREVPGRAGEGDYRLLTGNETGLLLLDYVCRRRAALGRMPARPLAIKTIVTTDLAESVARRFGVEIVNVLTGFKYIGEVLGRLEARGEDNRFVLGFEESCGYLTGGYVRDKDGVDASLMICEMFAWYRAKGIGLAERLDQLYAEHGYCLNTQRNLAFAGADGPERMRAAMAALRARGTAPLAGAKVVAATDYAAGVEGLPPSNVVKLRLEGGDSLVARPSGTEPKLKLYASVVAPTRAGAREREKALMDALEAALMGRP